MIQQTTFTDKIKKFRVITSQLSCGIYSFSMRRFSYLLSLKVPSTVGLRNGEENSKKTLGCVDSNNEEDEDTIKVLSSTPSSDDIIAVFEEIEEDIGLSEDPESHPEIIINAKKITESKSFHKGSVKYVIMLCMEYSTSMCHTISVLVL